MVNLNTTLDEYGKNATSSWEREFYYDGWNSTKTDENIINSRIRKAIQMVYADASKIGCGVTECGKNPSIDNWYMITLVCLYEKPLSNVVSDIYLEGEACSKCSGGSKCETSSGLCA
ncbi:hypothetical protein B9Z55_018080 [Caenorhabditis nigoni]|nr:hypothetical protein B9Z55_018080 [Caenorhabditis nigoni]